ncbi:TVP38/TMEM64 family protein [Geomicrobium sp. JSM 1781026]|uniref:TVP38/TMEM64 family protein n=1 Tax=Geomicrobium sp. JSM 1781026 TaxID=3344580 RepID=UPI0035BF7460
MLRKLFVLMILVSLALVALLYGEELALWIDQEGTESILITAAIATLLSLFPIIPYPIIGGILGAIYGSVLGSFVTWVGSAAASIIMFMFVRYGYQDWGERVLNRYATLARINGLFERNAFMTIFLTRLIPIVPSIIVNIYSALSRVGFWGYAIASSLGKIPSMILFATVGSTIVHNPLGLVYVAVFYGLFLLVVYSCYRLWVRYTLNK